MYEKLDSSVILAFFYLKKVKSSHQHVRKQTNILHKKEANHQNTFIISWFLGVLIALSRSSLQNFTKFATILRKQTNILQKKEVNHQNTFIISWFLGRLVASSCSSLQNFTKFATILQLLGSNYKCHFTNTSLDTMIKIIKIKEQMEEFTVIPFYSPNNLKKSCI